jgi:hypothetical protein
VRRELGRIVARRTVTTKPRMPWDFVRVFTLSRAELDRAFRQAVPRLGAAGMIWACWPKKSSRVASDLDDESIRAAGLGAGLVDVKVGSVSETWSGLKFVRRRTDR